MSEVPYTTLSETNSTPRGSIVTLEPFDIVHHVGTDHPGHLCRICKTKLLRKQEPDHTPMDCLSKRCEMLEAETIKLKDHDMKSRIQIKELENRFSLLEDVMKGLTTPKQQQAAPFNFNSGQKLRNPFKKAQSVDIPPPQPELNFDNILPPKRSGSRERMGLFGSLGAASQLR